MPALRPLLPARGQRAVIWLLLIALPLYGCSLTLLQWLGPRHVHIAAEAAPPAAGRPTVEATADPAAPSPFAPRSAPPATALMDTLVLPLLQRVAGAQAVALWQTVRVQRAVQQLTEPDGGAWRLPRLLAEAPGRPAAADDAPD